MRRHRLLLSVPFWLLILAVGLNAASEPDDDAPEVGPAKPEKLTIEAPETDVRQLFDLDLRRWPEERFYENLTGLIQKMSLQHGSEATSTLLDTAELFLGQMMVAEAESVLDDMGEVGEAHQRRFDALNHARQLLNSVPLEDFAASPLAEEHRPDQAFWAVMHAIASADSAMLNENLDHGVVGLMHQTRPVARAVLPVMIEAMIETKNLDLADRTIELMYDFPTLRKGTLGDYLRGRAAEKRRNEKTALEYYFECAKGFDRYAVRCRLAIANLAIADGGRGALMAAEDVLEDGLDSWRGDHFEIATLEKLTEVYIAAEERVEALILLSKIIMRFPGTDAAARAEALSYDALRAVYQDGFEGEIPLSRWLAVHLRLVPAFRYHPEYAQVVEELADHLMGLGGTSLAALEYRRALDFREDLIEINSDWVTDADLVRNHLKLAHAYTAGGQYAYAKQTLAEIHDVHDPEERNEINRLYAKIASQMGDADGLLRTHVMSPSADNLRNVSHALWEKQDWVQANEFYNRLWAEYPDSFDLNDATYLLIAAHRAGDENTAERVVGAFPGLTESESWVRLAQSFLTTPPDVTTLTLDAANGRLNRIDSALDNLEGSGF